MVVGAISSRSELVVIGSGPGGYVAALRAADAGIEVTVVERAQLGGTCLNVGCIPSKTLIEIANLRHAATTANHLGLVGDLSIDLEVVGDRLDQVSGQLRTGVASLLNAAGVTVVRGNANFARYDRLSIEAGDHVSHLEFDNVIVATGSRPVSLSNFDLSDRIATSTGALALTTLPSSMAVIGGGYIGVELGTAWAKLGVAVTIVEASDSILGTLPTALRDPVRARLDDLGVRVIEGQGADRPTTEGLKLISGEEIPGEIIVVAVGRTPNGDRCGLDTVGVTITATGHVAVDSQMRAASGIYAIGDLVSGPALAHKASTEAEIAVEAILGEPSHFAPAAIPAVVFSDPEIMTVGITPEQGIEEGLSVNHFPHTASARARTIGATTGTTIIVSDADETVLGIHAVGPHVSELAGEAALAIEMAATLDDLSLTIHAHPTLSESLAEAAWLAKGTPLHIRR